MFDRLREHPLFVMLNEAEFEEIFEGARNIYYKKGDLLCKQGLEANYTICIFDGFIKQYVEDDARGEVIVLLGMPGFHIASPFVAGFENHPMSIKALTEVEACLLKKDRFESVCQQNIDFLFNYLKEVNKINYDNMIDLLRLGRKNVRGRIAEVLLLFSNKVFETDEYILPISRKDLANYCNVSVENAVRVLSEFNKDGVVEMNNKHVKIINKKTLELYSEKG